MVGEAVNVTLVPEQIAPDGLGDTLTLTGKFVLTTTVVDTVGAHPIGSATVTV